MENRQLFLNGEFLPSERGVIPVRTHGFCYGTGCFEGIRGYWNEQEQQIYLFRLRDHYARLRRACKILQIELPSTVEELEAITVELVRRNGQREDMYLRPCAYKADQAIGVRLHGLSQGFVLTCEPLGDSIGTDGLRCCVSTWRQAVRNMENGAYPRKSDNAIPARAKVCGAYVNSAFAKSEAIQNGFDEALMLTHDGHVSEGSAENIFLVMNGGRVTPAPTENILLGITRDTIIELALRELGCPTQERVLDRTELSCADEILLCGTGAKAGTRCGDGPPASRNRRQRAYQPGGAAGLFRGGTRATGAGPRALVYTGLPGPKRCRVRRDTQG